MDPDTIKDSLPTIVPIFIGGIAVLVVVVIIAMIMHYVYNVAQPTVTRKAKVISKRTSTVPGAGSAPPRTRYWCAFEFEDGQRKEYDVGEGQYGLIAENDIGYLDTKGTLFWGFRPRADS
jgi:hypothetical protein